MTSANGPVAASASAGRPCSAIAHAERERLGRMIQFADPETWEQPSAAPGWWNRDVMAHLAANDTAAAQLVGRTASRGARGVSRAELGEAPFTVDGWNAWAVGRRTGLSTRDVLETWGKAAEAFLVYAARLDDAEWRDTPATRGSPATSRRGS